jgi:hypothetical protein
VPTVTLITFTILHQCRWSCSISLADGGVQAIVNIAPVDAGIRKSRDPIEHVKTLLQEHGWAEATELKKHDKEVCGADLHAGLPVCV